jgi:AcrR family transcriptional regulator
MDTELGLRQRKKAATRVALSHAAWSLMIERGLEQVTPDMIAEAADVSPRTFRNYFASREEALLYAFQERGVAVVETLRGRPADEPVWDSLLEVLPTAVSEIVGSREDLVVLVRGIRANPAMLAQHLVVFEHTYWHLAEVIAERTGTDAKHDLAPRLLAATTATVLRAAVELWVESDTDVTLPDLIRQCLAQLRAGFPVGAAAPAG